MKTPAGSESFELERNQTFTVDADIVWDRLRSVSGQALPESLGTPSTSGEGSERTVSLAMDGLGAFVQRLRSCNDADRELVLEMVESGGLPVDSYESSWAVLGDASGGTVHVRAALTTTGGHGALVSGMFRDALDLGLRRLCREP